MGLQHLTRAAAASLALATTACGHGSGAAAPKDVAAASRHVQIVHAMKAPERLALVARLRQRNGPEWSVNEDALQSSTTVVDPFIGFVRRARSLKPHAPSGGAPVSADAAVLAARAFVRKNADLLGVPSSKLLALLANAEAAGAGWNVTLEATYPTKGFESFLELTNAIDIELVVDGDGAVSSFVNQSKLHPARLAIEPKPGLAEEDARIYRNVVGRRVFAFTDDGHRLDLGVLEPSELVGAKLVMQIAPGPMNAWLTYRLAWLIRAAKEAPEEEGAGFYFFFYLVDTDTAEVVQDSPVPTQLVMEPP